MNDTMKPSNPKDAVGIKKTPLSCLSMPVMLEAGVAMLEGALKYGRHNYRVVGVRASVYFDATMRHLASWWEGEDMDPDSGLSHITKAIVSLVVLRDAMLQNMWRDDRPPPAFHGWVDHLNECTKALLEKYPDSVAPFTKEKPDPVDPVQQAIARAYTKPTCNIRQFQNGKLGPMKHCSACGSFWKADEPNPSCPEAV